MGTRSRLAKPASNPNPSHCHAMLNHNFKQVGSRHVSRLSISTSRLSTDKILILISRFELSTFICYESIPYNPSQHKTTQQSLLSLCRTLFLFLSSQSLSLLHPLRLCIIHSQSLYSFQDSCKLKFQGEGVTLKFLSCLNRLSSSIWEQLSCLESPFRRPEERTGRFQEYLAVCIVHHTRNILSVLAVVGCLL
ncbi:hypothetical protein RIF29_14040 [Crotalaria pallida]|uniref:Uncharacterized protein n=1 Tax=Crotalaria pallida TaxID=3830 RepID=A0AAN9ICE1_CROPI